MQRDRPYFGDALERKVKIVPLRASAEKSHINGIRKKKHENIKNSRSGSDQYNTVKCLRRNIFFREKSKMLSFEVFLDFHAKLQSTTAPENIFGAKN